MLAKQDNRNRGLVRTHEALWELEKGFPLENWTQKAQADLLRNLNCPVLNGSPIKNIKNLASFLHGVTVSAPDCYSQISYA